MERKIKKSVYAVGLSVHVPSYLSGFRPSSARMRFVSSMLTSSPFFFSFLAPRSRSSSLCRFLSSLSLCLHRRACPCPCPCHKRLRSEKLPRARCDHAGMGNTCLCSYLCLGLCPCPCPCPSLCPYRVPWVPCRARGPSRLCARHGGLCPSPLCGPCHGVYSHMAKSACALCGMGSGTEAFLFIQKSRGARPD